MSKKERLVAAIKNGTVIDHIPADKTYQVATLLGLDKLETPVTIGNNFASKKVKNKGIIKVSDKFFTKEEISRLSVVAPNVVLNNNPKCITNNEPMSTIFNFVDKEKGIVKCHYCDKEQDITKVELC